MTSELEDRLPQLEAEFAQDKIIVRASAVTLVLREAHAPTQIHFAGSSASISGQGTLSCPTGRCKFVRGRAAGTFLPRRLLLGACDHLGGIDEAQRDQEPD